MQTLPTAPPSKGQFLFNMATIYLEASGFEDMDFSTFWLPNREDLPGIALCHDDEKIAIGTISKLYDRSFTIETADENQIEKILDILIFTIKTL